MHDFTGLLRDGVLLRGEALTLGLTDKDLLRAVRSGRLHRVRHGAYAGPAWAEADEPARHALRCTAVLRQYGAGVALVGISAAVAWGAPVWGARLDEVHVCQFEPRSGRRTAGVVHHRGQLTVHDVSRRAGRWLSSPTACVLEVASEHGTEPALVVADWFAKEGHLDRRQLRRARLARRRWPDSLNARMVELLLDPASGSVGETRSRFAFLNVGIPAPVTQFEVRDHRGTLLGVTDFAWPGLGILGEFDGKAKYSQHRRPGESEADAVFREKQREDRLRLATGWVVVRFTWADLEDPARMLATWQAALAAAARRTTV